MVNPESYMAKAIHALREHLINTPEVDQQVIRDIFFLYTCEYFSQNIDCAESYLRILRSMVDRIGGFSSIDTYDRRLYWCGDFSLALESGRPPILPPFDNSRIYHTYHSGDSSIRKMGRGLERDQSGTTSPLDDIITDMISCAQSLQCILAAQLTIDKQRMFEHGADFLHRLLSLNEPPDSCSEGEVRQECCRQALLLWIFNVMIWPGVAAARTNVTNPRLARPVVAGRLKRAICRIDSLGSSRWDQYHGLLFWMLGLGSCVEGPGDDQSWFKGRLVQLAGLLQISSVEQLSDLYREYLYLETYERKDLTQLAAWIDPKQDTKTESPQGDMRVSSLLTPSNDSTTPSSDTETIP
jgi:hypothetical protein